MHTDATAARYLESMVQLYFDELMALRAQGVGASGESETLYALGYHQYSCGRYEAARDVFDQLTAEAPHEAHYWRALGAVHQQMREYSAAIAAYEKAIEADSADIVSHVHRAECQLLSDDIEGGLASLDLAASFADALPELAPWVVRARLLLDRNVARRAAGE